MSAVPATDRPFIAVDWGTSSFRAALIAPDGEILDELAEPRGISSFKKGEFAAYLIAACAGFVRAGGHFYLLSGMVGSKNGLAEVPYCPCPATAAEIAANAVWVVKDRIAIVPGLRSAFDDVMRGEETQILGAANVLGITDALMVLPGVHSKWVSLENGAIVGFNTFMTGEFYALLAQHSTLSHNMPSAQSVAPSALFATTTETSMTTSAAPPETSAYLQGIEHATRSESLLNTAYSVRVKSQFGHMEPVQMASYLSGLVIGEELISMQLEPGSEVVVVGSQAMSERYRLALEHLGVRARILGTQTTWAGLHTIYQHIRKT